MPATSGAESAPPRTRLSTLGANRLESSALIRRGLSRMHTIAASVGGTPTLSVPSASSSPKAGRAARSPFAPAHAALWRWSRSPSGRHGDSAHGRGLADRRLRRLAKAGGAASLQSAASAGWWLGFGYFIAACGGSARLFSWSGPIRLGAARRARDSGWPRAVHGLGFALARLLWCRAPPAFALGVGLGRRMAARSCSDRFSLERFRHGARERAHSRASGLADWASRSRPSGDLIFAAPATLIDARRGRFGSPRSYSRACCCWRSPLWRAAAFARRDRFRRRRETATDAAQPAAGRQVPAEAASDLRRYLALSDQATGPMHTGVADLTHLIWPESAFPSCCRANRGRSPHLPRPARQDARHGAARAQEDRGRSKIFNAIEVVQATESWPSTTKCISCPLANICR